jgi:pimeloyl-ACP methyl ester carboxylesterase
VEIMPGYVRLKDARVWYDEEGSGPPLVLLHPGGVGVDSRALDPNREALAAHFHLFLPERRGHGRTPDTGATYSYDQGAEDTIQFVEQVVGAPAGLLGVSDGAVVALLVAIGRPELVTRLACVAGVYHSRGWVPGAIEPGVEMPEFMIASYAAHSPDGVEHHRVVAGKLDEMHRAGPRLSVDDLEAVECRTLVMVGDDDEVTLEHALDFYRSLRHGELAVIPGTSHGLLVEKPDLCNAILVQFLTSEPVPTLAPIRRKR